MPKNGGGGEALAPVEHGGGIGRLRYLSGNVGLAVSQCSVYLELAVRPLVHIGEYPGGEGAGLQHLGFGVFIDIWSLSLYL